MPKTEYINWLGAFRHQLREMYGIDIAHMLAGHPKKVFDYAYEKGVDARDFADKYGLALTQSSNIN